METTIRLFAWVGLLATTVLAIWALVECADRLMRKWISDTHLFWVAYLSAAFGWISSKAFRRMKIPGGHEWTATTVLVNFFRELEKHEPIIAAEFLKKVNEPIEAE